MTVTVPRLTAVTLLTVCQTNFKAHQTPPLNHQATLTCNISETGEWIGLEFLTAVNLINASNSTMFDRCHLHTSLSETLLKHISKEQFLC